MLKSLPKCELCGDRHEAHQAHRFVNHQKPVTTVANTVVNASPVVVNVVVNARTKDRHKKTPERAEYMKQKMKEYRARKASHKARG